MAPIRVGDAPTTFNPIQMRWGPDRRALGPWPKSMGIVAWSGFALPNEMIFSPMNGDFFPPSSEDYSVVPIVTDNPPFAEDDLHNAWPSGTLWIAYPGHNQSNAGVSNDSIFDAPPPSYLTSYSGSDYTNRRVWWMYVVVAPKAGSSCTLTIGYKTAGTTAATLTISGDQGDQIVSIPQFGGPTPPESLDVVAVWTGGKPAQQYILAHPLGLADYIAVPGALPVDYTPLDAGGHMLQSLTARGLGLPGSVFQGQTYTPIAISAMPYNWLWIDGVPWSYPWSPESINGAYFANGGTGTPDTTVHVGPPAPGGSDITVPGIVNPGPPIATNGTRDGGTLKLYTDSNLATGGASYTATVTRSDTGATVVSLTCTSAQFAGGGSSVSVGAIINATTGLQVSIGVGLTRSGTHNVTGSNVHAEFKASFRADVPVPYTAGGPPYDTLGESFAVLGGYVAAALSAPVNAAPLVILGEHVTTATPSTPVSQPTAFLPERDGWYKVVQSSADLNGVGEYEFGYEDFRTIDRGHRNRPFYARLATGHLATLTSYAPSFPGLIQGGSVMTMTVGNWWAFGRITVPAQPAKGTLVINTTMNLDAFARGGLCFELCIADALGVEPDIRSRFSTRSMTTLSYDTTLDEPPSLNHLRGLMAPSDPPPTDLQADAVRETYCWIVSTTPIGQWVTHDNALALWDRWRRNWRFIDPQRGDYVTTATGDWLWFDGSKWRPSGDIMLTTGLNVLANQIITVVASCLDTGTGGTPTATVGWYVEP